MPFQFKPLFTALLVLSLPTVAAAQRSHNNWVPRTSGPVAPATPKSKTPAPTTTPKADVAALVKPMKGDSASTEGVKPAFIYVDLMPTYPGGTEAMRQFIRKNLKRPKGPRLRGKVYVTFVVLTTGQVANAHVAPGRGLDPRYDEAAIELINQLNGFSPGKKGGKSVDCSMTIPIAFE
ncbi:TonB family protein [Hymenobacter sp. B81]|uniref:TonB family protein n=1 Tax=Hymenobacter sp. B81 TaxID=3344878 RepID=UPI0037DCF235